MQKHHLMLAAVTALVLGAGLLWPVAGNAGSYYGPTKGAGGQCWHSQYGVGAPGMGYWGECAKPVASVVQQSRGKSRH